jgi:hypothetical protein
LFVIQSVVPMNFNARSAAATGTRMATLGCERCAVPSNTERWRLRN